MMNRRELVQAAAALAASTAAAPAFSQTAGAAPFKPDLARLAHRVTDARAPAVYFVPEVTPEAVMKVWRALKRPLSGRVALKTSFEEPGGPYVDPELLRPLVKETKATFVDTNGFSAPRNNTRDHLKLAADHGFSKVAPVDILDAEGSLDLPVPKGYHLKVHRVGSHFNRYDAFISVVKFKLHHLPMLGGTLKNLSITLASLSGKCNIHSAGANLQSWEGRDNKTTAESISDAVKAAMTARPGRWAFIAVMDGFKPDDHCKGARDLGKVGVFASTDPVALDAACTDITLQSAANDAMRREWSQAHTLEILEVAEKDGVGSARYRLVQL